MTHVMACIDNSQSSLAICDYSNAGRLGVATALASATQASKPPAIEDTLT